MHYPQKVSKLLGAVYNASFFCPSLNNYGRNVKARIFNWQNHCCYRRRYRPRTFNGQILFGAWSNRKMNYFFCKLKVQKNGATGVFLTFLCAEKTSTALMSFT